MIRFTSPQTGAALQREGNCLRTQDGEQFPIIKGIPRFVSSESYAEGFGLEWKVHALTQLDSRTGTRISQDRLERCLGTSVSDLRGKTVLEAGCGAGRFTELMVGAGAFVHGIDLSTAVEANRSNIGNPANYSVAQADLLALPFPREAFDVVLCLGVLQHLPSPEAGMRSLWSRVKPGGKLVIDHYTWSLSLLTKMAPVYRMYLKRLPPERAKKVSDRLVDLFFPLHWAVRGFYPAQMLLSRISPCLVYFRTFPELTKEQHYEFCKLDTFDHLADQYKHLRTKGQIYRVLESLGAEHIHVKHGGNGIEARCQKPVG